MIPGVESFLEQYHMIEQSDVVVAGVSGGADSVCLLLHLLELKEKLSFTLAAVHVQHGIRGEESLQDAAFVEEFCRRFIEGMYLTSRIKCPDQFIYIMLKFSVFKQNTNLKQMDYTSFRNQLW